MTKEDLTFSELILQRIKELKEVEAKATKGPWCTIVGKPTVVRTEAELKYRSDYIAHLDYGNSTAIEMFKDNGEFIAHSRNTLLPLLESLEKAVKQLQLIEKCSGREAWEFAEFAIIEIAETLGVKG